MSPWPSMQESQYAPLLNWEKLKWFDTFKWMSLGSNAGVSQKEQKRDISWFADAMNAPTFEGLAPLTWVGTAEFDPLRDEAEAYAKKCEEAGNNVIVKRFSGVSSQDSQKRRELTVSGSASIHAHGSCTQARPRVRRRRHHQRAYVLVAGPENSPQQRAERFCTTRKSAGLSAGAPVVAKFRRRQGARGRSDGRRSSVHGCGGDRGGGEHLGRPRSRRAKRSRR